MFSETRNSPFPDKCIYISPILYIPILCKHLYLSYLDKNTHNEQSIDVSTVLYIFCSINFKNTKIIF